ncbi:hypothetical protein ACFXJ5_38795 [Streptomyces sp. NPDC059373]
MRNPDPAGVATLFCDLWLRSDATAPDSARLRKSVHALVPDVDLPTGSGATAAQSLLRSTVAVRSAQSSDGSWSVVVAAQFTVRNNTSGSSTASAADADALTVVRYFAVPMVASDSASGTGAFTVTAAPAEIAGPGTAKAADSAFGNPLPADGAVVSSLGEFFDAYLTGVGEVDRYLSPGTQLTAVSGSGYTSVTVDQAAADSDVAGGAVPADGPQCEFRPLSPPWTPRAGEVAARPVGPRGMGQAVRDEGAGLAVDGRVRPVKFLQRGAVVPLGGVKEAVQLTDAERFQRTAAARFGFPFRSALDRPTPVLEVVVDPPSQDGSRVLSVGKGPLRECEGDELSRVPAVGLGGTQRQTPGPPMRPHR